MAAIRFAQGNRKSSASNKHCLVLRVLLLMMKKNNTATIIPDAQRSFSEPLAEMEVHVLAVDDSVIDRRVIEGLLKTSSYKGM